MFLGPSETVNARFPPDDLQEIVREATDPHFVGQPVKHASRHTRTPESAV